MSDITAIAFIYNYTVFITNTINSFSSGAQTQGFELQASISANYGDRYIVTIPDTNINRNN